MNTYELLTFEEGYREKPYFCSEMFPTIAIGKRIGPKHSPLNNYQFTISKEMAELWLRDEVGPIVDVLSKLSWFKSCDEQRQTILISMAYQLGIKGLFKFKKMIRAIELNDWNRACFEAKDSKWFKQTPVRAKRHIKVLGGMSIHEAYGL